MNYMSQYSNPLYHQQSPPTPTSGNNNTSFVIPVNHQQHSPLLSSGSASGFNSPNLSSLLPGAFSTSATPSSSSSSTRSYRHSALLEGGNYHSNPYHSQSPTSSLPLPLPHQQHQHRQTRSVGRVPSINHLQQHTNNRQSIMLPTSTSTGGGSSTDSHGKTDSLSLSLSLTRTL